MDAHTIYTIAAHAHSTTGANNTERRQRLLEAQGWRIRRFRWEALAHPEEVVAQIRALLEHS